MANTEKIIGNVAVGLVTLVGLLVLCSNLRQKSFFLGELLMPGIFILFGIFYFFKAPILRVIPSQFQIFNPFLMMNGILFLFLGIGVFLTGFLIYQNVTIVGPYVVSVAFIVLPAYILYGLKYGYTISQKSIDREEQYREELNFDSQKLTVFIPVVEASCEIFWTNIQSIIYTDYYSSDYKQFIFYLKNPPKYKFSESRKWYIRIAKKFSYKNKVKYIDERAKHFEEIPKMVELHLRTSVEVDLSKNPRKATLIKEKITQSGNIKTTYQQWKPNYSSNPEVLIFDHLGRSLDVVKSRTL